MSICIPCIRVHVHINLSYNKSIVAICRYLYTDEVSLFADPWAAQREESEPRAPSRSSCPHCASPTPTPTSNSSINGAGSEGASSSSASESASAAGAAALANDAHVRRMRRLVDVLYAAHKYLVRALVDAAVGALAHMLCAHTAATILALSFLFEVPHAYAPYSAPSRCFLTLFCIVFC